jgi:hypothetical protein
MVPLLSNGRDVLTTSARKQAALAEAIASLKTSIAGVRVPS